MKKNDNKWKLKPKYEKRYISRNSFENGIDSILKRVRVMVFNATVNNISVISWRSVLLVEKTGVPGENHRPVTIHWQTLSHNVASSTSRLSGIRTHNISCDRHLLHKCNRKNIKRGHFIHAIFFNVNGKMKYVFPKSNWLNNKNRDYFKGALATILTKKIICFGYW